MLLLFAMAGLVLAPRDAQEAPRSGAAALSARCGLVEWPAGPGPGLDSGQDDCSLTRTNPLERYDPAHKVYRIPVVVHIIRRSDGRGEMTDENVRSQIEMLNQAFGALPGTFGEPGIDTGVEFYVARVDPDGLPTTGITRTTNDEWYRDRGDYWNWLAWEPARYMNIYTNDPGGPYGYVPALPQSGLVGRPEDRIVMLHTAFGRDATFAPHHLGRATVHEVGHYLGLRHTFDSTCAHAGADCAATGDLLCDTPPQPAPTLGCPTSPAGCAGAPPALRNYMDYANDACQDRFTPQQARRMRCTLEHWRVDLARDQRCVADADGDGALTVFDWLAILNLFQDADPRADFDGDGELTIFDLLLFQSAFDAGCG